VGIQHLSKTLDSRLRGNERCGNAPPLPPSTPEQQARAMAHVQRVMREIEARREQGE
jgi:hypothetical protein